MLMIYCKIVNTIICDCNVPDRLITASNRDNFKGNLKRMPVYVVPPTFLFIAADNSFEFIAAAADPNDNSKMENQLTFTSSKSTIETLEKVTSTGLEPRTT